MFAISVLLFLPASYLHSTSIKLVKRSGNFDQIAFTVEVHVQHDWYEIDTKYNYVDFS